MMASSWVGTTRPEGRELRACGLAALAESGVLVLPVWLVLTEARGLKIGVMALAVPFVAVYVGGAVLACRFRASRPRDPCLLYTSPSPRDLSTSRMPSSA